MNSGVKAVLAMWMAIGLIALMVNMFGLSTVIVVVYSLGVTAFVYYMAENP